MIAFLAARRKLNAKKVEPTVQELNEQQENAQIKDDTGEVHESNKTGSCAFVFAVSLMLLITSAICLIPAITDGNGIFYVAAGAFAGLGCALLIIGCCFIDCGRDKGNKSSDRSNSIYSDDTLLKLQVDANDNIVSREKALFINPLVPSLIENSPKKLPPIRNYCNLPTVCS